MDQWSLLRNYDQNSTIQVRELLIPLIDFLNGPGPPQAQVQAAAAMLAFWLLNKKRKKRKRSKKDPVQITIDVPTPGAFWVLDLLKALGALSQLN